MIQLSQRLRPTRAFTLIELCISVALMALVLTAAYACLNAGFSSQRLIEPRADLLQNARVALRWLTDDLKGACALPKGAAFLGSRRFLGTTPADTLDFATHHYTPTAPGEGDYCEQSYFLEPDKGHSGYVLWRRRNPRISIDPLSGGNREEIARGITGLQFEYYDGFDWFESWGDPNAGSLKSEIATPKPNSVGLPDAVRITLSMGSESQPELTFQTIVQIAIPVRSNTRSAPASDPASTGGPAQSPGGNPSP